MRMWCSLASVALVHAVLLFGAGGTSWEAPGACQEGGACSVDEDGTAQLQLRQDGADNLLASSKVVPTQGSPAQRDEGGSVIYDGMLCLVGGRGTLPIDCFRANESKWIRYNSKTYDIHHVQPVVHNGKVWIVAGWTGPYPNEYDITNVLIWDPVTDTIKTGCSIPTQFRTGAAGVVNYKGRFFIAAGASGGHLKSVGAFSTPNLTLFRPSTCQWVELKARKPKFNRDHFQAVLVGSKMVLAGGRDSPFSYDDSKAISFQTEQTEILDLGLGQAGTWVQGADMPVPRGGTTSVPRVNANGNFVYVLGGETDKNPTNSKCQPSAGALPWIAHNEVHQYNVDTDTWTMVGTMAVGRHAHGSAILPNKNGKNRLWTAGGVECAGGAPMTSSTEQFR